MSIPSSNRLLEGFLTSSPFAISRALSSCARASSTLWSCSFDLRGGFVSSNFDFGTGVSICGLVMVAHFDVGTGLIVLHNFDFATGTNKHGDHAFGFMACCQLGPLNMSMFDIPFLTATSRRLL